MAQHGSGAEASPNDQWSNPPRNLTKVCAISRERSCPLLGKCG
jgi:hypothetical protein